MINFIQKIKSPQVLKDLKVSNKLIIMLLMPVITLGFFSAKISLEKSASLKELAKLEVLSQLTLKVSTYVHETQKERGATGVFLGSKGTKFAQELPEQRELTDLKLKEFHTFLESFDKTKYDEAFSKKLNVILQKLDSVEDIRTKVDQQKISTSKALGFYTSLNADSLGLINYIAKASNDPEIASLISAYVSFLQGKERAGIERAIMSNTFAQDSFSPGVLHKFIGLTIKQDTYFDVFKSYASEKQIKFFEDSSKSKFFAEVARMRKIALDKGNAGGFNVDVKYWFTTMTNKINQLKDVENFIAADVNTLASSAKAKAQSELYLVLSLTVFSILVSVVLILMIANSLTSSTGEIAHCLEKLAEGDLTVKTNIDSKDELGQMSNTLNQTIDKLHTMQEKLDKNGEKERKLAEEGMKFQQMLDNMPTNILLASLDGEITYANPQSINTLKTLEELLPIKADEIVGNSYDIFHAKPEHQRKLLSDPNNLPHQAIISVGEEKLDLLVSPLFDQDKNFTGTMLTWSVVTEKLANTAAVEKLADEGVKFQQMLDNMPTNILLASLDGEITYANPQSINTLKTLEDLLPIKADEIVGNSYDIFHAKPEHQRKLLSDPNNLPHQATIGVGEEKLDLLVSPLFDQDRNFTGTMLTWSVVTEKLANTAAVEKLADEGVKFQQMLDNMPTNILLASLDGEITYANPQSVNTLKTLEDLLPIKADEIVGQSYDIFHKKPEYQRKLLSDPNNLPHQAVIGVGEEKLDLLVSPLFDQNRNFTGTMLTWSVVTEKIANQERDTMVRSQITDNVQTLGSSVRNMESNSEGLYAGITNVSNNSEDVRNYISSVSVASEELISSINEISKNTDDAATMTKKAVDETESTEKLIQDLQARSLEIGEILKVVTEIANQTNLLALNATIEAARAGEAGKGFAVVANEVKELATRTTEATGDIGNKISAIQNESELALNSISETTNSIRSINEISVTVASSVEEQSAVTAEIGRSMKNSSEKVNEMVSNVGQIQDLVKKNVESVNDVNNVSGSLSELVQ